TNPKRNNPTYLFLTIAYGLASSIPPLGVIIGEVIQANPAILRSSLDTQFRELIVKPCRSITGSWESGWPRLVIIDGLDECEDSDVQEDILSLLSSPYCEVHELGGMPLRFLICSRPEPTIREIFDSAMVYPHLQRAPLNDDWNARRDIEHYLADRLDAIRRKPRYSAIRFPDPWPPRGVIHKLSDKSCGQFIYVSTTVSFVDSKFYDPCRRLEVVLRLTPEDDHESPFGPLDALYHHVLSANPNRARLILILGFILHPLTYPDRYSTSDKCITLTHPRFIEMLLDLSEGQVNLDLQAMHSVLRITDSGIDILHTSFSDFLHEKSRSGDFYIDSTYFQSFTVSCALRYLNKALQNPSR
ncbi:hypothetical protein V5O48_010855, partial [Marasmius crinis-equi]